MDLLKIIKKNLFTQNFVASVVSLISPCLEFGISKYLVIKRTMYITARDSTK